jgi:hypothetical protein
MVAADVGRRFAVNGPLLLEKRGKLSDPLTRRPLEADGHHLAGNVAATDCLAGAGLS